MINHITAKLSLSIIILITRASIAQRLDDFSSDDNIFLSDQQASLDPSLDLFTTNDPIVASVPQACHAECDTENLFSNDIPARVKPRQQPNQDDHDDACLPPLPPNILNIYDSKQILNILSGDGTTLSPTGTGISGTDSSPDDTPAAAAGDDEKKDSIIDFPGILDPNLGTTSTSDQEQRRSKCPGLWDMATTPVCSSMNFRRDNLRYPKDYHWTLFNARYCNFVPSPPPPQPARHPSPQPQNEVWGGFLHTDVHE